MYIVLKSLACITLRIRLTRPMMAKPTRGMMLAAIPGVKWKV